MFLIIPAIIIILHIAFYIIHFEMRMTKRSISMTEVNRNFPYGQRKSCRCLYINIVVTKREIVDLRSRQWPYRKGPFQQWSLSIIWVICELAASDMLHNVCLQYPTNDTQYHAWRLKVNLYLEIFFFRWLGFERLKSK